MNLKAIAERLRKAESMGKPIPPLRSEIGPDNLKAAYAIQRINTEILLEEGRRIVGKKIGLTSIAVQQQLGVDQPDFGILFDDKEVLNGDCISVSRLVQPKIEAELAFVLAEDIDFDSISTVDLIQCIDYVLPSLEIVGSRIADWDINIVDTIADNASASHFVLGHRPRTLDEIDIVNTKMVMAVNGKTVSTGVGKNCMGSPLNALMWLAKKMIELDDPLQAGDVVLSGALGPVHNVAPGETVEADFEGIGSVSVQFIT